MLFEQSSTQLIHIEEEIINSNSFFNLISKDKPRFTTEEILDEIKQAEQIGAHRYLLKDDQEYVGVLEYLRENPNDGCTWFGLLVIRSDLHSKGYGSKALEHFYEVLRNQHIETFRIGVIAENKPAQCFWQNHGFKEISKTTNSDNKTIFVYEKKLSFDT